MNLTRLLRKALGLTPKQPLGSYINMNRVRAESYRLGTCICGEPMSAHFDKRNRKIDCSSVAR